MGKRLVRSKNNKMITGVCGGVGEYFNIDPTIVRVLWALGTLFSVGIGVILYIAMSFIVPEE